MDKKIIKALETIKDFCNSREEKTACLKCPMQSFCSEYFDKSPKEWEL